MCGLLFVFVPHGGSNEQQSVLTLMNRALAAIVSIACRILIRQTRAHQKEIRLIILFNYLVLHVGVRHKSVLTASMKPMPSLEVGGKLDSTLWPPATR